MPVIARQYWPKNIMPGTIAPNAMAWSSFRNSVIGLSERAPAMHSAIAMTVIAINSVRVTGAFFRIENMSLHQCRDAAHERMCRAREDLFEPHVDVREEREDSPIP